MRGRLRTKVGTIFYSVIEQDRRTISLRIANNQLTVAIPRWKRINVERLLKRHISWITKHYAQMLLTKDLMKKDSIMLNGKYYMLYFSKSTEKPKVSVSDKILLVQAKDWRSGFGVLFDFISDQTEKIVLPMAHTKAEKLNLSIGAVRFRKMRRWGSCNSKSEITINSYASMLPVDAIEYIVSHEVAHIKELNHSKRFWGIVSEMYPNHEKAKKELNNYSVPNLNKLQNSMVNLE